MSGKRGREWFDDDGFWCEMYPFMFPDKRFSDAPDEIGKLLSLVKPSGKAVLDLCCGPGRCSIPLAREGYEVTGVDRTAFLLDKARKRALEAGVVVEWVQMDMRDFVRGDSFDLALSMFTSFGYFHDKAEDLAVLGNIFASLKPGGVLLVDVMGKERLAKILQPVTIDSLPDGTRLIQRHEIFDGWTRIRNEWILIRDGKARSFNFHHTVYSGQELKERMQAAGFSGIRLFGNLEGDAYGPDASRLIIVGGKPA